MNAELFRKIARKTLRIFIIVYLILLPISVVVAYFLRESKLEHDGYALSFPLFALLCAGAVLLYMILLTFIGFAFFLFGWSLFDLMRSEFKQNHNKILWFILILLLPAIGIIFYLIISPEQKVQEGSKKISF